jgi:opacity protein-like surface antigen
MRALNLTLAAALLASTILAGCVVVPAGGWYGSGYGHGHGRGWRHQPEHAPHPYYYER